MKKLQEVAQRIFFMLDGDKKIGDLEVQIESMAKTLYNSEHGDSIEFSGLTLTKLGSEGYRVWLEVGEFPADEIAGGSDE